MSVTCDLRGTDPFLPSWLSTCGTNPTLTEVFDKVDDMADQVNIARNWLINGSFRLAERYVASAASFVTDPADTVYTYDRWQASNVPDGGTMPQIDLSIVQDYATTIPNVSNHARITHDGTQAGLGANSGWGLLQKVDQIDGVMSKSREATVSFWAKSTIPNKKLGVSVSTFYGTGGAPSATEGFINDHADLTNSWQRFEFTGVQPDYAARTFGTTTGPQIHVQLQSEWGINNASDYGDTVAEDFGVAGSIDIAGVQVNHGTCALTYYSRSRTHLRELAQYYYQKSYGEDVAPGTIILNGVWRGRGNGSAGTLTLQHFFSVKMRSAPTVTTYSDITGASGVIRNFTAGTDLAATPSAITSGSFGLNFGAGIADDDYMRFHWVADAEV